MSNELKMETFVTAKTKINNVDHKSNVTIDWTGMSLEDIQALAQRSIIIKKQNADRTNGTIPESSYTLKAVDYRLGVRAERKPANIETLLGKLSPEELAEVLAKFAQKL